MIVRFLVLHFPPPKKIQIYIFLLKMWKMNPESLSAPFTFKLQTAPVSSEHCIHVVRTCGTDSSPLVELQVPWRDDDDDDDGSVEKMMKLKTSLHQSLKLCRVKSRFFFVCVCVYGNIVRESQSV